VRVDTHPVAAFISNIFRGNNAAASLKLDDDLGDQIGDCSNLPRQ
jgi:hypothetical protein